MCHHISLCVTTEQFRVYTRTEFSLFLALPDHLPAGIYPFIAHTLQRLALLCLSHSLPPFALSSHPLSLSLLHLALSHSSLSLSPSLPHSLTPSTASTIGTNPGAPGLYEDRVGGGRSEQLPVRLVTVEPNVACAAASHVSGPRVFVSVPVSACDVGAVVCMDF